MRKLNAGRSKGGGVKKKKSMFNIVVCLVGFSALSERNDYHGLSLAGV